MKKSHIMISPSRKVKLSGFKTFFCPCGTVATLSTVTNNRYISSTEACNDLVAYSLILSCCWYTCGVQVKLRKMLNITGGMLDDFLSHFMCCCRALVQEWREVEIIVLMIKLMVMQISLVFFAFALAFILAVIFRRMSRRLLTRPAKNEWTLCQEHFVHSSVYALPDWRLRLLSSNELTVEFFFSLEYFIQ